MQIGLIFCIGTLYHMAYSIATDETDDDGKTSDDNYKPVESISEKKSIIETEAADETDDYAKPSDDYIYPLQESVSEKNRIIEAENKEYEAEKKLGDTADLFGTNQHYSYPETYKDLGRRFVPQYPYTEISNDNEEFAEANLDNVVKSFRNNKAESHLIPVKAPPELVLAVATKAALIEAANTIDPTEENVEKEILRTGNYWNAVWREDVDPNILRTQTANDIQPLKVKVMPGSDLYNLVTELKKISPRLVYVINKE